MEYKIGDKVRIVKRTRFETAYPFCFVREMALLAGQVFTIKEIRETKDDRCSINGDYHLYCLSEKNADSWHWHSSMFEPAESSELKVGDTVRVISKGFEERHPLLTEQMEHYIGKTFKITRVFEHPDGNTYYLSGAAAGWYWPNGTLEKVSDNDTIEVVAKAESIVEESSKDKYSDDSELIEASDCEISASIYTDSIKIIL